MIPGSLSDTFNIITMVNMNQMHKKITDIGRVVSPGTGTLVVTNDMNGKITQARATNSRTGWFPVMQAP
jgi:hypothetical protein